MLGQKPTRQELMDILEELIQIEYPYEKLVVNHPLPRGQRAWTQAHKLLKREHDALANYASL